MCGIAGICALFPVRVRAVAAMTALMPHRGPDDEGLWQSEDSHIVLGHRRLSIIEVGPTGHQPMQRDKLVLVFNGEIYNYKELQAELINDGVEFHTNSDTEVILAAYQRWGKDFLSRLNGMFAIALLDQEKNLLFCARDRFGEKPFLFAIGNGFFAFGSEYKALLKLSGVARDIDRARVLTYMVDTTHGLDDGHATAFQAINQLLPGEALSLDLETLSYSINQYWRPRFEPAATDYSFEAATEHFRELLVDSVALRLRSDVPVGSCLSGGLDSSSIVCLARDQLPAGSDYHVFTGRFPGTSADEWERAKLTVDSTEAVSHVVCPDPAGFLVDLPHFMWTNELPVASSSQYAQYCVFRLAAENGITVLLDGQGADELLAGYEQYFQLYLTSLPRNARRAEATRINARYPGVLRSPRQTLAGLVPDCARRTLAHISGGGSDISFGLADGLYRKPHRANPKLAHPLASALWHDSFVGHLPSLLRYGDRNSMAHSREVRLPFCDHRLAEFVLTLPPEHLMGNVQTKRLLREAMRGILPEGVRTTWRKQGFRPPQEIWFATGLADTLAAVIESQDFACSGWWNVRWWRRVLHRFQAGETHLAWVLWRPFIMWAWDAYFVARIASEPAEAVAA